MMHWVNMPGMGMGGFGFGGILMILFWILSLLGIIYIFKGLLDSGETAVSNDSAEHILKKRYVSGEINREEYNDKLSVVQGKY